MTKLTRSYVCGTSTKPLIGETIGDYFDQTVACFPDNEAFIARHQGIRRLPHVPQRAPIARRE